MTGSVLLPVSENELLLMLRAFILIGFELSFTRETDPVAEAPTNTEPKLRLSAEA